MSTKKIQKKLRANRFVSDLFYFLHIDDLLIRLGSKSFENAIEYAIEKFRPELKKKSSTEIEKVKNDIRHSYYVCKSSPDEYFLMGLYNFDDEGKRSFVTDKFLYMTMSRLSSRKKHDEEIENKWNFYKLAKPYFKRQAVGVFANRDFDDFKRVALDIHDLILKPLDANNIQLPLESTTDSTTKIEEVEVEEETTTEIIQQEENILSQFTPEEWDILYRVARCEAGNWCKTDNECGKCDKCADAKEGQKNVIYVILNRLNNNRFPNDIKSIVFAKSQFTVTNNKKHFYSVYISDYCKANVQEAVKDYQAGVSAQGALYFNCISANYWTSWAEYVFTVAVGHHFFINKNKN